MNSISLYIFSLLRYKNINLMNVKTHTRTHTYTYVLIHTMTHIPELVIINVHICAKCFIYIIMHTFGYNKEIYTHVCV